MARDERERRDAAGVGPDPDFSRRLYPIDELDGYRVADGEPDVRGWEVRTLNGREVGEVEDLLVDPARGEVVMIEVDLDRSGRHVSVPLRSVQLDRDRNCIIVDSADLDVESGIHETRTRDRMTDEDRRYMDEDMRDVRTRDVRYGVADRDDRNDRLDEQRLDREVREADRADARARAEQQRLDREARAVERTDDDVRATTADVDDDKVIEEVVVRRRVIDADAVERDRLE